MKRLISLALVLMLALGVLSVTAYACDLEHDGEDMIVSMDEIMPRAPVCPNCNVMYVTEEWKTIEHVSSFSCPLGGGYTHLQGVKALFIFARRAAIMVELTLIVLQDICSVHTRLSSVAD